MKTPNKLLLLLFAVMLTVSCQDNSDLTDASSFRTNGDDIFSDLQYESNGYIAIAKSTRWNDQLTRDIEAIGGKCTGDMSKIGMMRIEALDPSFASKAGKISGLLHLVPDVIFENVVPVEADMSVAISATDPPNSRQ